MPITEKIDVRRAADRFVTKTDWLDSKHSFSFGHHYDPANVGHGLLRTNNDDIVAPGGGFHTHPHQDMEIVTWVLRGSLLHQDSTGHSGVIYPGLAQRMSAGTGILHSEGNDSRLTGSGHQDEVHFIQMWVVPGETGLTPGYEQLDIADDLRGADLITLASGMAKHSDVSAIRINNEDAALHAARLQPGKQVTLPEAPCLHVFVAQGEVDLEGAGTLDEGDAVRLTEGGGQRVTSASDGTEILVWEMQTNRLTAGRPDLTRPRSARSRAAGAEAAPEPRGRSGGRW